jgi:hypothetical protein
MSQKSPIAAQTLSGAAAISTFFDTEAACAAVAARHAALKTAAIVVKRISNLQSAVAQRFFEISNSRDGSYWIPGGLAWAQTNREVAGNEVECLPWDGRPPNWPECAFDRRKCLCVKWASPPETG